MHELIASSNYESTEMHPGCAMLFELGAKCIEREFSTSMHYELSHNKSEAKVELRLMHVSQQEWYGNPEVRDTIIYKLTTHMKIVMSHYSAT